jgi:hypothetical protein
MFAGSRFRSTGFRRLGVGMQVAANRITGTR